jgi:hypothetical protein
MISLYCQFSAGFYTIENSALPHWIPKGLENFRLSRHLRFLPVEKENHSGENFASLGSR